MNMAEMPATIMIAPYSVLLPVSDRSMIVSESFIGMSSATEWVGFVTEQYFTHRYRALDF